MMCSPVSERNPTAQASVDEAALTACSLVNAVPETPDGAAADVGEGVTATPSKGTAAAVRMADAARDLRMMNAFLRYPRQGVTRQPRGRTGGLVGIPRITVRPD